jgi:hypothetical protein
MTPSAILSTTAGKQRRSSPACPASQRPYRVRHQRPADTSSVNSQYLSPLITSRVVPRYAHIGSLASSPRPSPPQHHRPVAPRQRTSSTALVPTTTSARHQVPRHRYHYRYLSPTLTSCRGPTSPHPPSSIATSPPTQPHQFSRLTIARLARSRHSRSNTLSAVFSETCEILSNSIDLLRIYARGSHLCLC